MQIIYLYQPKGMQYYKNPFCGSQYVCLIPAKPPMVHAPSDSPVENMYTQIHTHNLQAHKPISHQNIPCIIQFRLNYHLFTPLFTETIESGITNASTKHNYKKGKGFFYVTQ